MKIMICDSKSDIIERPAHYCAGRKYEPWDVIEDWNLDYFLGNALKYIARAGRKGDEIEDLKKAVAYLNRKIDKLGDKNAVQPADESESVAESAVAIENDEGCTKND